MPPRKHQRGVSLKLAHDIFMQNAIIIDELRDDISQVTAVMYQNELTDSWETYSSLAGEAEITQTEKENPDEAKRISEQVLTLHTRYMNAKAKITEFIQTSQIEPDVRIENVEHVPHHREQKAKLPSLKLKTFSGDLTEWVEFIFTCQSVLTDEINDTHRLQCLKDALIGEPRELIAHILPGHGAFERACQILTARYQNIRAIVNSQFRDFFSITKIEKESSIQIRKMLISLNSLISSLNSCNIDTKSWDAILIYCMTQNLDGTSLRHWEEKLLGQKTVPPLTDFVEFLETRIVILETTETYNSQVNKPTENASSSKSNQHRANENRSAVQKPFLQKPKAFLTLKSNYQCPLCTENHMATRCKKIFSMTPTERRIALENAKLCTNCFYNHETDQCSFQPACKKCSENHHTLLHESTSHSVNMIQTVEYNENEYQTIADELSECDQDGYQTFHVDTTGKVMLATAMVPVTVNGKTMLLKTLLDQGSTTNLISTRACNELQIEEKKNVNIPIYGLGNKRTGSIHSQIKIEIGSIHDESFKMQVDAFVINRITEINSMHDSAVLHWRHLRKIPLADPTYTKFSQIDLLIGASTYADIIQPGIIRGQSNQPIAQKTMFGWVVSGGTDIPVQPPSVNCNMIQTDHELNKSLQRFWEIEEINSKKILTPTEQEAEIKFVQTLQRRSDGKFMVDLPFIIDPNDSSCLGKSYLTALKRYQSIQRRFEKEPKLKKQYDAYWQEYLEVGHMEKIDKLPENYCMLPHHPVVRESSSTTKVRPVMDGSAKTSNGFSLNDRLLVGPTIQPELFDLLLNWRKLQYAMTADIEKMYRQIWVHPNHTNFQCIVWQPPEENEIQLYRLKTVTFGTSSAPFQAIRALHEIGERIKTEEPTIAKMIQNEFYVDDLTSNAESIEEAQQKQAKLTTILQQYGFNLRKWKASHYETLQNVKDEDREDISDPQITFKTLGVLWQPNIDSFIYESFSFNEPVKWTKRTVLSEISKLFDPLGFIAPCIIKAKVLMQDLWRLNITWDEKLPVEYEQKWLSIFQSMKKPIPIKIPRWIGYASNIKEVELCGFCDASSLAYAAVVYIRIKYDDEHITCNLIASKTRVAPIRIISIPRMELCSATILAQLMYRIMNTLLLPNVRVSAHSDSMITLSWIAAHPSKWKTFVANRVSEVQQLLPPGCWQHITTKQNPADVASRGALIEDIAQSELWLKGPKCLMEKTRHFKSVEPLDLDKMPELRKQATVLHIKNINEKADDNYVLNECSRFIPLLRFTALAKRWLNAIRTKTKIVSGPITAAEIWNAEMQCIRLTQDEYFADNIERIRKKRLPTNPLKNLDPFIDQDGLLRMNGRVANKNFSLQSTAIILPAKHKFTEMLITHYHEKVLHGGVQLTLQAIREKYRIIHARIAVKSKINTCILCFRYRKVFAKQKMAKLPSIRTEQARPFAFVGCDYTGYFEIKTSERKNAPTTKAYIALFICLCTKAIHLELVTDLSTAEFLIALDNFIARRGIPIEFHSDNATNFIGASKELREIHNQMFNETNEVTKIFAEKQIKFKTIPARASHMAGIWERSIGLVKYHLKRVLRDTKLTARRFDHVLKQIEACLNSRPLWAITNESDDASVLTPSHFFNFQAINTLPKPDLSQVPLNRLNQYQYLQRIHNEFWKLWHKEYLNQLQPTLKWQKQNGNLCVGQIVLISEDNLPPSRWALGKITAVYPGKDGLIRVVDVQHNKSIKKRPIHKLAVLPIIDNINLEQPEDSSTAPEYVEERTVNCQISLN